jgi:hypothetical protein
LRGWQWLFLLEGIPSVLLGFAVLAHLTDRPATSRTRPPDDLAGFLPFFLIITSLYGYTFWAPIVIRDALHASNLATGLITGAIGS